MSPRAYCALQCAVPAILIILDRRGGSIRAGALSSRASAWAVSRAGVGTTPAVDPAAGGYGAAREAQADMLSRSTTDTHHGANYWLLILSDGAGQEKRDIDVGGLGPNRC